MKSLTGTIYLGAISACLLLAGNANAAIFASINGGSAVSLPTEADPDFYFIFKGDDVELNRILTVTCDGVTVGGFLMEDPSGTVHIDVVHGMIQDTSGFLCDEIFMEFDNGYHDALYPDPTVYVDGAWFADIGEGQLPTSATSTAVVTDTINNVQVLAPGIFGPSYCDTATGGSGGPLSVDYSNNGTSASYFDFASSLGGCSLTGTLYAVPANSMKIFDPNLPPQGDIDIWTQ
ncbi:hypothetical protein [Alcanivorax sp. S71-1-4]|uniref:hypothetical protein n=1 Tax=Alcanivorax sp. S71-1-4 TaxID=1177159 RepID=UPI00135C918C|nr:hypothetical protein [Alcanivorax sp. S71-1-4]